MNVDQQQLSERLFCEALALPPEKRLAFLEENCVDSEVRSEVESLIAYHTTSPLDEVASAIGEMTSNFSGAAVVGRSVGAYRLMGRIGQGGMGTVYRAVRADDQFQKTVAIKMLRFPESHPTLLERFRRERQILASLEHPSIARLLDGGAWAPPGSTEPQPYIVMEYVEGLPLTTYCEQQKLTLAQRLRLFRRVCEALSYAHRQLVVHRDVKPGNVLVTADGDPKLLDFGVSKLLGLEPAAGTAALTTTGFTAMTPEYASPEQVRGQPVSALMDVYSLGAVLYELLTGRRPHQVATHDPLEIAQVICECAVAPPGIDCELDSIVLKAMQKDAVRRYQSMEQFSEDIRRYLEGLPIVARPATLMYRTAKFAQRHWLGLTAAAAVFMVLLGGIGVSTWEAARARRAEQTALSESATARAINDFLQNDLLAQASASNQAGPSTKPDPHLEVRTALDRAALRIAGKFDRQPEVEATIRYTIGQTYTDLGLYLEAQTQVERALELQRRVLGPENPKTLRTIFRLGCIAYLQGRYAQAEGLFKQSLEIQRRVLGPGHPDTLSSVNNLANAYDSQGEHAQAELLYSQTLEIQRRVLGPEHPDTLRCMNNLASIYESQGKYAQAEELQSQAVEIKRRVLGSDHPSTLVSMNNLATIYDSQGKYAQAEALYSQALEIRRRVLGLEHPSTLNSMHNLADAYLWQGKYAQAEELQSKTLEIRSRVLGAEHPDTLTAVSDLASLYQRQGEYRLAEVYAAQALSGRRRALGSQSRDTMASAADLAMVYQSEGRFAESEPLAREALQFNLQKQPEQWQRFSTESLLGVSLAGQKRYAEAEPLLLEGYRGMEAQKARIPAPDRYHLDRGRHWIVRLYEAWRKPEKAAAWRKQ
jgi:serine/threonine protein kinase/Tfp pilus assembly protein PilF